MVYSPLMLVVAAAAAALAKECTVETKADGADDSSAILDAFQACAQDSVITFREANYSALTPVSLENLKNVTIRIEGNILLPQNVTRVQEQVNITLNRKSTYATPWFYIQGEDVKIHGSTKEDWGAFHGFGQQWWNVNNKVNRPQLATFNVTGGLLSGLKVIYPIAWGWNLPGKNIRVENHYVLAKPTNGTRQDTHSFPFNTDGFNLSGQNITVDGYHGWNGDDCVSVVNGAKDIVAMNGYCGFSSHGLSIGSLGKGGVNASVENVLFKNWTMDGAVYGARFKSWTGGNGLAKNITWQDIVVKDVSTAIFVTQNYYDQDFGKPENASNTSTHIDGMHFVNFTGNLNKNFTDGTCISDPCWNYVSGIQETGQQTVILDLYEGTAANLQFTGIDVKAADTSKDTTVLCDPAALAKGEQDTLGFNCTDGKYEATQIKDSGEGGSGGKNAGGTIVAGTIWVAVAAVVLTALSL